METNKEQQLNFIEERALDYIYQTRSDWILPDTTEWQDYLISYMEGYKQALNDINNKEIAVL